MPYIDVLVAQTNALTADQEVIKSQAALSTDLVSLYKAIGGGWSEASDPVDVRTVADR